MPACGRLRAGACRRIPSCIFLLRHGRAISLQADIALNIVAYLPLGALLFFALRPPLAAAFAFLAATIIAAALSLALESAQMFLPTRIASNVDLISNTAGAAIGALGALLLTIGNNPLDSCVGACCALTHSEIGGSWSSPYGS
jgi:glycopeptide antibiotics resistance protein